MIDSEHLAGLTPEEIRHEIEHHRHFEARLGQDTTTAQEAVHRFQHVASTLLTLREALGYGCTPTVLLDLVDDPCRPDLPFDVLKMRKLMVKLASQADAMAGTYQRAHDTVAGHLAATQADLKRLTETLAAAPEALAAAPEADATPGCSGVALVDSI